MGMGEGCCGREMACVESGPGTETLVIVVVVTLVGNLGSNGISLNMCIEIQ